jgi:hypothetical protein
MADVASKQQTANNGSVFFTHHRNTQKKTHRTDQKKTDKPDGKPAREHSV